MRKIANDKIGNEHLLNKGFTLIELLAVIIILAIIALIATPIILNVIDDAKRSAGLSEANMIYSGITNYCAMEDMKEQIDDNYVRICNNSLEPANVSSMVNLGKAEILEIAYDSKLTRLKVKSNGYIYTLVDGKMTEGDIAIEESYNVGDLLKVDVGNGIEQNIYVLEVNGDEVTGILDHNLGGQVSWISSDDFYNFEPVIDSDLTDEETFVYLKEAGPITATNALNERTADWINVTSKRLPSATEIVQFTEFYQNLNDKNNWEDEYFARVNGMLQSAYNCTDASDCKPEIEQAGYGDLLLPEWITINLRMLEDWSASVPAYWTTTQVDYEVSSHPYYAWGVDYMGELIYYDVFTSVNAGIRPVITININNVSAILD